jgi:hypothetical protein
MGYYMTLESSKFRIDIKNHRKALKAIKALSGGEGCGHHFSWVDTTDFKKAKTLAEALEAWRWDAEMDEDYNIIGIDFGGEKLGDDEILFRAIAPFVESGSYLELQGEDGCLWRWRFDNGGFRQQDSKIVWED